MFMVMKLSDLALAFGMRTPSFSVLIENYTFIKAIDGTINIRDKHNQSQVIKMIKDGYDFDLNRAFIRRLPGISGMTETFGLTYLSERKIQEMRQPDIDKTLDTPPVVDDLKRIELLQKKVTLKKTNLSIKLDEIRIARQEGILVPFEEAEKVFLYAVNEFHASYFREIQNLAIVYSNRAGLPHSELIALQKELKGQFDIIIENTRNALINGLLGVQDESIDNHAKLLNSKKSGERRGRPKKNKE